MIPSRLSFSAQYINKAPLAMDAPAGRRQGWQHHHQTTSASFTWTQKKVADALTACLQVFRGNNEDPFLQRNITNALSKLSASPTFSPCPSGEVLTAQALRGLLHEYHEKYRRICAIAELPYSRFNKTEYKIWMSPPDYEKHVQVSGV